MNSRCLALATLLLGASCSGAALIRPPATPLERAIGFREGAEDGWHGITAEDALAAEVSRVVDPARVDAESRIEVLPDVPALRKVAEAAGADPAAARLRLEAYVERPGSDPVALHLPGYDELDQLSLTATPPGLDDAHPTAIELPRTIAREGDRMRIRAILEDGAGAPLGDAHDSFFRIGQMGWNATYHPSVVLARPFRKEADDAEFRLTPGIAWLHTYTPRHDEEGAWQQWMRATHMSVGPHALLLQFDTEDEVEIGLGVTAGFWGGVLQLGFGYNLMADGGQDRHYLFIGSSMISLAQAADRSFGALSGF